MRRRGGLCWEDLVVIAAGYIVEMKDLLAANPGMESRFPTTLHFADYTAAELMSIAERVLEPQKMKLEEGAHELLLSHFEQELAAREPDAKGSNGRLRSHSPHIPATSIFVKMIYLHATVKPTPLLDTVSRPSL